MIRSGSPFLALALGTALASGCGDRPPPAPVAEEAPHAEEAHAAGEATLRAIMVDLGRDMGEVSAGLWAGDFARVAAAAGAVADHPHVAPGEMQRIQGTLGPEFADFVTFDRRVHDASVALRQAAAGQDTAAVLDALEVVQRGCVGCHARFRERLRTPAP